MGQVKGWIPFFSLVQLSFPFLYSALEVGVLLYDFSYILLFY